MNSARSFSLALRFALREMRGGLSGFYIFLACIALGVAAIGGVNSVARSVSSGITAQGQSILGGDISFALNQREVTPAERAFIENRARWRQAPPCAPWRVCRMVPTSRWWK